MSRLRSAVPASPPRSHPPTCSWHPRGPESVCRRTYRRGSVNPLQIARRAPIIGASPTRESAFTVNNGKGRARSTTPARLSAASPAARCGAPTPRVGAPTRRGRSPARRWRSALGGDIRCRPWDDPARTYAPRMGRFIYDSAGNSVDIDDRTLAHLRIVIMNKLRRSESFMFDVEIGDGSGRRSFWMHSSVPLQFHFFGSRQPRINREWVEALMQSASSPHGLSIVPEPPEDAAPAGPPAPEVGMAFSGIVAARAGLGRQEHRRERERRLPAVPNRGGDQQGGDPRPDPEGARRVLPSPEPDQPDRAGRTGSRRRERTPGGPGRAVRRDAHDDAVPVPEHQLPRRRPPSPTRT